MRRRPDGRASRVLPLAPAVLAAVAAPVLLAAAPLGLPRHRRPARTASAAGLTLFVMLGAASVGLYYAPAAFAQIAAAVSAWRR